jgi:hypothetical protein
MLERIAGAMLAARATLRTEYSNLHKAMLAIVRTDAVCRSYVAGATGSLYWRCQ